MENLTIRHEESDGNYEIIKDGKIINCITATVKFCEQLVANKEIDSYQLNIRALHRDAEGFYQPVPVSEDK